MTGLCPPGARRLLALGSPGDRADDMVEAMGAIGARGTERVVIGHKTKYLRGRDPKEIDEVFRRGTGSVGVEDVPSYPTELDAVSALIDDAQPGDVVAVMCLQDRERLDAFLRDRGATVDTPDILRSKVEHARHG
jgi:cyanophycin synthetase